VSGRQAIWLVARREVLERTREKAFFIGTGVTILILCAIIFLPQVFGGGDSKVEVATASPQAAALARAAAEADDPFDVRITVRAVGSDAEARRLVRDGDADVAIVEGGRRLVERGGAPDGGVAAIQAASRQRRAVEALRSSGADPSDAQRILAPPPLATESVDADADARQAFAFVALIVLYGQLISYGIWVATGVVEEKTSRIVEILLATIRPRELLSGKVLGIGLVGLGQLLFIGAVGLVIASASGEVDVGGRELSALPILLGWFVVGYALYACAFAIVGAIVPRQEDVQSTATPVMLAILASFFLSFQAISEPSGTLSQVLSFVPFSSPLVMPVRMIAGDVAAWEVLVALALALAAIGALVALAGRIYGNAVLQTGGKIGLMDAFRAGRRAPRTA
jgi:ABC-2 type transport system permease protein